MANEMAKKEATAVVNKQPRPVDLIVMHIRPHFDEVLAVYLLKAYGKTFFTGVGDASIETWGEGKMLKEYGGKTADDLLREQKILCIGTCGGMFDEHVNGELTCTHLVAEYLGVIDRPELQKILQFCKRVDHDGKSMPFDLHSTMKEMYDFFGDGDDGMQTVYNWAMQAIESCVFGQKQFHACAEEFKKTGNIINGGPVKIALVTSDNPKMHKWIRHFHSADIIVKLKTTGNMIILTSPQKVKKVIDMRDLARIVRETELKKRKLAVPQWKILESDGAVNECPWWYYYKNGEQLLNGTVTSPDVEPTALSLTDMARAIALACAPKVDPCTASKCYKTCNKYQHGLIACRQKRFNLKKGGER